MNDLNRNARWARLIAEELQRAGTRYVVLCPGSRNSPLLFALAQAFGEQAISHLDERSAGFIAIGLIRATGAAVAVCVTSGSALANLLPAVTEADAAELPLIVISADRPWEQHHNGSPQSMAQRGILQAFVRAELALGEPSDSDHALRALRAQVSRLAQEKRGPVHLNVPLRDPLPPLPDPRWQPAVVSTEALHGRGPATAYTSCSHAQAAPPLQREAWMHPGRCGIITVGCLADNAALHQAVVALARSSGFPVLADGPSNLRSPEILNVITTADALVSGLLAKESPNLVIQIGPAPLTRAAFEWLDRSRCPWLTCGSTRNRDMLSRATLAIEGDSSAALHQLSIWLGAGDAVWNARWRHADDHARALVQSRTVAMGWSESLAVHLSVNHPGFSFVHLASSMTVRHANLHLLPSKKHITSNRGINGIDGTLGTFLGVAHALAQADTATLSTSGPEGRGPGGGLATDLAGAAAHTAPTCGMVIVGDLAFLHDLPALAAAGLATAGGALVVMNNGGGGIFDFLPVATVPHYQRWVRTTHSHTFGGAAELFGLIYHACRTPDQLAQALHTAATSAGPLHLIECFLHEGDTVGQHRALIAACGNLDGNEKHA